jgi:Na+-driven multidrug efflux pump
MKSIAIDIPGHGQIQTPSGIPTGGLFDDLGGFGTGLNLLQVLFQFIFIFASVIAIIMVLYAGIQWVISGGDKTKIESARNRLVYALVGLVIVVLAFFIVRTVIMLLGGNPDFFLPE